MSTAPDNLASFGPEWCGRLVARVNGQGDTHKHDGSDYDNCTLASVFTMEPGKAEKSASAAFIPSTYTDYDARSHDAQRQRGSFVCLTGDVDSGDHPLAKVESLVRGFVGDAAWLIYSSAHARPGDMRWRIIIPIERELAFEHWHDAQNAFFNYMEQYGVEMDRALARAAQLVYLPNVPSVHAKSGDELRDEAGAPLYYARATSGTNAPGLRLAGGALSVGVAAIRRQREADQRERERIRKEAEERRAKSPPREGANIIEEFNRANSIPTLLELYGYERSPANSDDWHSPHQTGSTFATRVIGDKWISLSGSDVGARLGENFKVGCFGDAYDLFVHYEHGGEHKAAFRALYAERRAGMPVAQSEPPPLDAEDPGPEPIEEMAEPDDEPDFEMEAVPPLGDASDTFELLDLNELENLPPPEWLVHELVVQDGLTVIYGDPGAGKSFIALDMALRLSLGMTWHEKETKRVGVLYIAGEGARGLGKRVRGWRVEHGMQGMDAPFLLLPIPVALLEPEQRAKLLRTLDEAMRRCGFAIGLVVVDTVSRSLAGAGENGADEMGALVSACDVVRIYIGGAVLGVHHSGKDRDKGMRGSTVLLGACDGVIRVEKAEDVVTLTIEKQKDAEQAAPIYMQMKKVALPHQVDDDPQSTLVPYRTDTKPIMREQMTNTQVSKAFALLTEAWNAGKPLSSSPQVRTQGRYAPSVLSKALECSEKLVVEYLTSWLENDCLAIEIYDQHSKSKGLRVINTIIPGASK